MQARAVLPWSVVSACAAQFSALTEHFLSFSPHPAPPPFWARSPVSHIVLEFSVLAKDDLELLIFHL